MVFSCVCGKIVRDWMPKELVICFDCGSPLQEVLIKDSKKASYVDVINDIDSLNKKYINIVKAYNMCGDLTDGELAVKLGFGKDKNKVRPRRYELVNKLFLVEKKDKRVCPTSNKNCDTWGLIKKLGVCYEKD